MLVASSYSGASTWVNEEITYWLTDHPPNTVLIVRAGGDIYWDEATGDFSSGSDAIPEVLRGRFEKLPSVVDIEGLDPAGALFRDQVAVLAARLHGKRKEDLYDRDVSEHRKLQRLQRSAIGILATLLVLTLAGASAALIQRDAALAQARLALSRALAAESAVWVPKDVDLGMLLAVQAYRTDDTVQARSALLDALMANPPLESIFRLPGSSRDLSPAGYEVAVAGRSGVTVWDVATERRVGRPFGIEKRGEHPPPTAYPPFITRPSARAMGNWPFIRRAARYNCGIWQRTVSFPRRATPRRTSAVLPSPSSFTVPMAAISCRQVGTERTSSTRPRCG